MGKHYHGFQNSLQAGQAGEWVMRQYHTPFYDIEKTGRRGEMKGYDFIFSRQGMGWRVEVKTDFKAHLFGNLIVETKSSQHKQGWSLTSQADILIWYIWYLDTVLYFRMDELRQAIPVWRDRYGATAKMANRGYKTTGIKVPINYTKTATFAQRLRVNGEWFKLFYKQWQAVDVDTYEGKPPGRPPMFNEHCTPYTIT